MRATQQLLLAGLVAVLAAATYAYAHDLECAAITGCMECTPQPYNVTQAALRFNVLKTQRAKVQAEKQLQRAQVKVAKTSGGAQAQPAAASSSSRGVPGRHLKAVDSVDVSQATDAANLGIQINLQTIAEDSTTVSPAEGQAAGPKDVDVFPSCTACAEGYSLVTKSVRGRPPMGRCECAAGYGIQYTTVTSLNKKGQTKLKKTFTCTKCDGNSVPLTPAAGLKITNAGIVMLTAPIDVAAVEAAGKKVLRKDWLPGGAAKKFDLVPGQCVECPLGSVKTADGISCEPDMAQ